MLYSGASFILSCLSICLKSASVSSICCGYTPNPTMSIIACIISACSPSLSIFWYMAKSGPFVMNLTIARSLCCVAVSVCAAIRALRFLSASSARCSPVRYAIFSWMFVVFNICKY